MTSRFLPTLLDEASRPFRKGGHFAYHYARGKLSSDCIFRELLKRGIFPAEARFLDLGCGQGSLVFLAAGRARLYEKGVWPGYWAAAPKALSLRGYELMARDAERAALAFGRPHPIVDIRQGDMRAVDFGAADVVTILDALHYLSHADQDAVIGRIRKALPSGGLFLTRVGDAGAGLPYHICNWVDHAVTFARGHRLPRLFGRKLTEWVDLLEKFGATIAPLPGA